MAKVITQSNLRLLLADLGQDYRVIAPQKNSDLKDQYFFGEVQSPDEVVFGYPTTILPPKEFLLPPTDVLFEFQDGKLLDPPRDSRTTLLFGLGIEDLKGVQALKDVFSRPIRDEVFNQKTQSQVVIGLDRFSPPTEELYDLYLMSLTDNLLVGFAATKTGKKILENKLFVEKKITVPTIRKRRDEILERKDLAKIVESSRKHPVWEELAQICFGCGICSYVCPLCYCYETEDRVELGKNKGARCRSWDSCMLYHFTETTAGNFRPLLADRIYNWYFHKFVRMPAEYGYPGCVDCNRCIVYCPAKINYRTVLDRLIRDAK